MKIYLFCLIFLTGCTLSFTNVSSIGKATDLIDGNQNADADVKPVISVPIPL